MAEPLMLELRVRRARLSRALVFLACLMWRVRGRRLTGWLFALAERVILVESLGDDGRWHREEVVSCG